MAILIFCDLETTGLDYKDDEIWMIHAKAAVTGHTTHNDEFTAILGHDRYKMEKLPQKFRDIHARFFPPEGGVEFPIPNVPFLSPRFCGAEFSDWKSDRVAYGPWVNLREWSTVACNAVGDWEIHGYGVHYRT